MPLHLDVETTGKFEQPGFRKYYDPLTCPEKYPHTVVEITYWLDGSEPQHLFIYPTKWPVPVNSDGYVYPMLSDSLADGFELKTVLDDICKLEFDTIVGHSISFDIANLLSDANKIGHYDFINKIKGVWLIDTMELGKDVAKIKMPSKYGKRNLIKSPTLLELYQFLFKEPFDNAHNSLCDVQASKRCYEELVNVRKVKVNRHKFCDLVVTLVLGVPPLCLNR